MIRIAGRCRDAARRSRARALTPALEGLEDRKLLSTTNGGRWYFPNLITYSFVPDGTSIGGISSDLFLKFDAIAPRVTWQAQFKKAAAIWQQVAGINLAEVPDNGTPIGGTGNQQGDPYFGDIRIGGNAMGLGTLAFAALPPPLNGGSLAGDIVINTAQSWKVNNDYDMLTVAIHEFGHALGMGHSAIQAASMYGTYVWMKQSLNSDDISGIQSIYGTTKADATPTNNVSSGAIDLTPLMDPQGRVVYGDGAITSLSNFEWYKVRVPDDNTTGTMTITMQSTGLSSLSPRLTVLSSPSIVYGQLTASNIYGATVTLTVNGVSPGQYYYIRAAAAQNGPGSNGAFGLLINAGTSSISPVPPPPTAVGAVPDQGGGTSPDSTGGRAFLPRFRRGRGFGHGHDGDDSVQVIKLGDTEAKVDFLYAKPGRFLRPSRFRFRRR